jgi:uncharacterized protein YceK
MKVGRQCQAPTSTPPRFDLGARHVPSSTGRVTRKPATVLVGALVAIFAVCIEGCATYRTISTAGPGSPKVLSGTRLDLVAIRGDQIAIKRFRVEPPGYPLVDVPFSFAFDLLIFPLTTSVAAYEYVFESH